MSDPNSGHDAELERTEEPARGGAGASGPDHTGPDHPKADDSGPVEPEWKRRKRLAAVFGEGGLPQVSAEERAREGGDRSGTPDEWFRSQVPPHHG